MLSIKMTSLTIVQQYDYLKITYTNWHKSITGLSMPKHELLLKYINNCFIIEPVRYKTCKIKVYKPVLYKMIYI